MPAGSGQQTLQLNIPPRFDYGDWIRHAGVETACNRLALWLVHGGRIWLTSSTAGGKTHLLNMLQQEHPRMGLITAPPLTSLSAIALVDEWIQYLNDKAFWAIDINQADIPPNIGFALFHLLERARDMNRPILLAWRPASETSAPPELMSRLKGSMEYLQVHEPASDEALKDVLQSVARARQWDIQSNVLDTMLQWLPRELDVLLPALLYLESTSLADRKKRLSRSWIRSQLEQWDNNRPRQSPLT